jgi:hypothetical protein
MESAWKLAHYVRAKPKSKTFGYVLCGCGRRISPNKRSCLACAVEKAEGAATPGPRETKEQ